MCTNFYIIPSHVYIYIPIIKYIVYPNTTQGSSNATWNSPLELYYTRGHHWRSFHWYVYVHIYTSIYIYIYMYIYVYKHKYIYIYI